MPIGLHLFAGASASDANHVKRHATPRPTRGAKKTTPGVGDQGQSLSRWCRGALACEVRAGTGSAGRDHQALTCSQS
jgi:hypothetical protein